MHVSTVYELRLFSSEAERTGNPMLFLDRLANQHDIWHGPATNRILGFLLYHHFVIENFKALNLDNMLKVSPYSRDDFITGGTFEWKQQWDIPPDPPRPEINKQVFDALLQRWTNLSSATTVDELANFSFRIENWHNLVHYAVGRATNTPMGDPRANIYLTEFWNLHFLIQQEFERNLRSFGKSVNLANIDEIVEYIEEQEHSRVREI
jgi:hypothetical protein